MLVPCRDCRESGRCDIEEEKSRLALFAWAHGGLIDCSLRIEKDWHGSLGVKGKRWKRNCYTPVACAGR